MTSRLHLTPFKHSRARARVRSLAGLPLSGLVGAFAADGVAARRVEHRNGAGHLEPTYEEELRARVKDRARKTADRAFVSGASSTDSSAEESGEEFVMTVTSGESGGESANDEESSEERGGPFVETDARTQFAYDTDESNPPGATREPFPTT